MVELLAGACDTCRELPVLGEDGAELLDLLPEVVEVLLLRGVIVHRDGCGLDIGRENLSEGGTGWRGVDEYWMGEAVGGSGRCSLQHKVVGGTRLAVSRSEEARPRER